MLNLSKEENAVDRLDYGNELRKLGATDPLSLPCQPSTMHLSGEVIDMPKITKIYPCGAETGASAPGPWHKGHHSCPRLAPSHCCPMLIGDVAGNAAALMVHSFPQQDHDVYKQSTCLPADHECVYGRRMEK